MLDLFCTSNGNNDGKYANPDFDAAIDASRVADSAEHLHSCTRLRTSSWRIWLPADRLLQRLLAAEPTLKGTWHSPYGYWYLQYGYIEANRPGAAYSDELNRKSQAPRLPETAGGVPFACRTEKRTSCTPRWL